MRAVRTTATVAAVSTLQNRSAATAPETSPVALNDTGSLPANFSVLATEVAQQPEQVLDRAFWQGLWAETPGWRVERKFAPYERFTSASLVAAAGGAAPLASADLRGARVLVPLCGDSPVLRYFFDLGCHVVGVEFEADVVRRAAKELCPGAAIAEEALPNAGTKDGTLLRITRDAATVAAAEGLDDEQRAALSALPPASMDFYAGDFYAVAAALAAAGSKFDVVYDRGSFIATGVAGRPQYVAAIEGVAATAEDAKAVFGGRHGALHVMVHLWWKAEENRGNGPPFHTPRDEVVVPTFPKCRVVKVFDDDALPAEQVNALDLPFSEHVSALLWFS